MTGCNYWAVLVGYCHNPNTRRYLAGPRCPLHTPARLNSRPEPGATADYGLSRRP